MRNLLTGLVFAGCLLCSNAFAANNDVVEIGLGVRMLFNSGIYAADNPDVDYQTDMFPIIGDQAMGIGINGAIGHRFDSRRGPYEVLIKYSYSMGTEDEGVRTISSSIGPVSRTIVGTLDQHDMLLAIRLPGSFMPVPLLNYEKFYYDLGMGVTTLSYDFAASNGAIVVEDSRRTRSGLAYNLGMGFRQELSEDLTLSLRADFIMAKIQDVENASGGVARYSPNANGARLQIGLVHYFEALF